MHENTREALIALRDVKETEQFVEKITPLLEASANIELAYMLGRIDQSSRTYATTLDVALRTIITQSFDIAPVPQSSNDYLSPEQQAAQLTTDV